ATLSHTFFRYGGGTINDVWSNTAAALATTNNGMLRVGNSTVHAPYFEGVIAWGSGDVTITNTVIAGADRGVTSDGSAIVRLTNCTLDDNRVGLYGHGGELVVANTIIANSLDYGIDNVLSSPIDLSYSNVWSTQGVNYHNMADPTGSNGNVSVDPAFKNHAAGNYQLQYVSPMIDAADGAVAPETDCAGAPRYDDPRVENTGTATGTGAYADIGAYEFVEAAESPIDLIVTEIDAPGAVTAGEWVTVSWTIRNDGTEPATGPWHDAIALVQHPEQRPTTMAVTEILVGEGVLLAPGDPYVAAAHVRVPGAVVGELYWQVATNARAEIFEGRYITNNVSLAAYPTLLDVPALVVDGGAVAAAFSQAGESHWFRFTPENGEDVRVDLDLDGAAGTTELYVGLSYVPTRDSYEAHSPEWQAPDTHISLADTVSTTYYVLAYGTTAGPFEIGVTSYNFSLTEVSPERGGNTGQVTLLISGGAIPPSSTVTLRHATAGAIPALATHWTDGNQIAATFDLTGVAPGTTDVEVADGATVRTLTAAFTVEAGGTPDVWLRLSGPEVVRTGRPNEYTVSWGNQGAVDAPVHLLKLHGSALTTLQIPETGEVFESGLPIFAMAPDTPLPSIPPGATASFHFVVVGDDFGDFTLEVRSFALDDPALAELPVDWEIMRAAVKPDELTDAQWNTFFDALIADLGDNWADVGNTLADDALVTLREPASPLYPRTPGVRLRVALLQAMGRVAMDIGWIDGGTSAQAASVGIRNDRASAAHGMSHTISRFSHSSLPDLPGTTKDRNTIMNKLFYSDQLFPGRRRAIHQAIRGPIFLTRTVIHENVQALANNAGDQDILFYYFAGHGEKESGGSGSGGFYDAEGGLYEYREFLNDIKDTKAKHVVVVIDACYSGSFIDRVKKHHDLPEYLKDHITVVASSSSSETSGEDRYGGKFTVALIKEMRDLGNDENCDGYVSFWEAYKGLPQDLNASWGKTQTPQWYGPDVVLRDPTGKAKEGMEPTLAQQLVGGLLEALFNGLFGGSNDPNDKVGSGYGSEGWVPTGEPLHYTIHFENIAPEGVDPALVWPAQEVVITDQLSTDLDWSTFALGNLGLNNTIVSVPRGQRSYQAIAAVDSDANPVMITATLNAETGLVTWRLHSYDDQTGQLPEDPLAGFLPANDETHAGEGFVTFSIRPQAGLPQGTVFSNRASIVFDLNAPIVTNVVTQTLDTQRPTSAVTALPITVGDETFTVGWSGSDPGGSGVAGYDVYVSDDGGPFTLWQSAITTTQAVFTGVDGHTYGFYSVATDNVGYRQTQPGAAQATTTVQAETDIYLPLVTRG
ncbi:MAG: DUF7619 domain-containing protein, partial [Anaerolineae bacterium]